MLINVFKQKSLEEVSGIAPNVQWGGVSRSSDTDLCVPVSCISVALVKYVYQP